MLPMDSIERSNKYLSVSFAHRLAQPFADLTHHTTSTTQPTDLQSKLVLLTLAFPSLKIIWSSSPYQTAIIFAELKKSAEEPDPIRAVQIGLQTTNDGNHDGAVAAQAQAQQQTFSQVPQDMLRIVPGVTEKVARALILEVGSLWELTNMDEEDIAVLVGKEAARQIWGFFNRSLFD